MELSAGLIYDAAALIFLIAMVAVGWHQGLVKTIIGLVGGVVAMAAAFAFAVPVSQSIYEQFVESKIVSYVDSRLGESAALPGYALELLEDMDDSTLLATFGNALAEAGLPAFSGQRDSSTAGLLNSLRQGNTPAQAITDRMIAPAALNILRLVTGIVLFSLFSLVIKIAAGLVGGVVSSVPLIGPVNRLLGAAVGGAWAFIILYVFVVVLNMLISIFGGFRYLNEDILQSTQILSQFIR